MANKKFTCKGETAIPKVTINKGCIEHDFNRHLFSVILILYGAVLSYAMYAVAIYLTTFPAFLSTANSINDICGYFKILIMFFCFLSLIVEDLGEIVKLDQAFPFKRTTRYVHEFIICFLFLSSFALLSTQNSVSIIAFGMAIAWGGIWCNQLKEEYKDDYNQIVSFCCILRNFQFTGGLLISLLGAVSITIQNNLEISRHLFFAFVFTYLLWKLAYYFYTVHICGNEASIFLVSIFIPDSLIIRGTDDDALNLEKEK